MHGREMIGRETGFCLDASRRLFHIHTPKTGGTALAEFLSQFFPESQVIYPAVSRQAIAAAAEIREGGKTDEFDAIRFFSRAHIPMRVYEKYRETLPEGSAANFVCMFRNPLARLISLVGHIRRISDQDLILAKDRRKLSAEGMEAQRELIKICREQDMETALLALKMRRNRNSRARDAQVAHLISWTTEGNDETWSIENVLEQLDKIDLIGVVEDYLGSLQKICWLLDLPMPEVDHQANVSRKKLRASQAVIDLANELCKVEWQLYGEVLRRHYLDMAHVPDPATYNRAWAYRQAVPASKTTLDLSMDQPIYGWGWHVREGTAPLYSRWTKARAVLYLPLAPSSSYRFELHVGGVLDARNLSQSRVEVNGAAISLRPSSCEAPAVLDATIPRHFISHRGWTRVDIIPAHLDTHETIQPGCGDFRRKGLAIHRIVAY